MYTGVNDVNRFYITVKAEGTLNLSKNETFIHDKSKYTLGNLKHYLGHTQAPTSSERTYDPKTSHPFQCGQWIVAHNGVLTNYDALKQKIKNTNNYNKVDSSLIPALLDHFSEESENEVEIICETLSLLQGTFSVWVFCTLSGAMYIARSGSTLYADLLTNDFSSLPFKGYKSVDEGVLYTLTREGLTSVGFFTPNSPFFTL